MNTTNAISFALIGSIMEILPRAFPACFPPTGYDEASRRALWLAVMGAVQIALGIGFLLTVHAHPFASRLFARVPSRGAASIPLPSSGSLTVR